MVLGEASSPRARHPSIGQAWLRRHESLARTCSIADLFVEVYIGVDRFEIFEFDVVGIAAAEPELGADLVFDLDLVIVFELFFEIVVEVIVVGNTLARGKIIVDGGDDVDLYPPVARRQRNVASSESSGSGGDIPTLLLEGRP